MILGSLASLYRNFPFTTSKAVGFDCEEILGPRRQHIVMMLLSLRWVFTDAFHAFRDVFTECPTEEND